MPRNRKKQNNWLQNNSRYLLTGLAATGLVLSLGCLAKGASPLNASPYIQLGAISLPFLGAIAYGLIGMMAIIPVVTKNKALEGPTWLGLFVGTTAMTIFSGYLLYVMFAVVQEPCLPCLMSAILSLGLWGLTLVGKRWDSLGQLLLPGLTVTIAALIATTGLYAYAQNPESFAAGNPPPIVQTQSGESEIALAKHLESIGAKKYGAWWCPHCHAQQTLFGQEAFEHIDYVECDEEGVNPQPDACRAVGVQSYPTWEINGQTYAGVQSLDNLATISGYDGSKNFINQEQNQRH